MRARTLGIVLAGGLGERLAAGRPKAAVELAGITLLERALATLREICDEVVVAAPAALALPCDRALRVDDPPGAAGPLAGLVAGLGSRPFGMAAALGVDLPFASSALLEGMAARIGIAPAVVPVPGGRAQPLAAWYTCGAREPLAAMLENGQRALVPAVLSLSPLLLEDDVIDSLPGGAGAFLNLNTPADLADAERRLASSRGAA